MEHLGSCSIAHHCTASLVAVARTAGLGIEGALLDLSRLGVVPEPCFPCRLDVCSSAREAPSGILARKCGVPGSVGKARDVPHAATKIAPVLQVCEV